jgi:hypothetical protein
MGLLPLEGTPNIYTGKFLGRSVPNRMPVSERLFAFALAVGCLVVLLVAAGLTPAGGGFGTHRQLGLEECAFLVRTGLPCPGCGMTTSFAWFARGNLAASFYVQPMAAVLALLCGMCVWAGGYIAVSGKPVHRVLSIVPEKLYLYPLLALAILAWAWKMYIHLHGLDGWK